MTDTGSGGVSETCRVGVSVASSSGGVCVVVVEKSPAKAKGKKEGKVRRGSKGK